MHCDLHWALAFSTHVPDPVLTLATTTIQSTPLPHPCLQPPPSWGPGLAALKPTQFQPFAPNFCSQGTVQLLLGEGMTAARAAAADYRPPACLLLLAPDGPLRVVT